MSNEENADKWRRRERSFGAGTVLWALLVSVTVAFRPEAIVTTITTTQPGMLAAAIMVSLGFCAGFFESVYVAIDIWSSPDQSELTEWEA